MSPPDLLCALDHRLQEWWKIELNDEELLEQLDDLKRATDCGQTRSKIWMYSALLEGHLLNLQLYEQLKSEKFYSAWCLLEQLEILLAGVRGNREHLEGDFGQTFLNNAVSSWQCLYPYRLFFSSRETVTKSQCSICGTVRSVMTGCHHRKGKLYDGEFCKEIVKELKCFTWDIVANPVHKSSVAIDPDNDHYDYSLLRAVLTEVTTPRHFFKAYKTGMAVSKHSGVHAPAFPCPCMRSARSYEDCCMQRPSIEADHLIVVFLEPMRACMAGWAGHVRAPESSWVPV